MRLGVDYYPEHWDESRWPVDAKLMREAGISVVRLAEFAWCKMEPYEGRFDFSWLDRVLEILHAEGIESVLGTPTATPPAWLMEHYPEIYPADQRGYRRGFGTRLHRCLSNETMRKYSRLITEAMAEHFASNPAVIGWQTDNEFESNLCYCDVCADKFREWLREKYETLDALNAAWGTIFWSQEYTAWAQIPLPWEARCGKSHSPSLQLEYRRFSSQMTVEFQDEQIDILRRVTPNQFINHNLMGLHDSVDYYDLCKDLDFITWDNYPCGSLNWQQNVALSHDVMRGIKERNYWVVEQQCGVLGWEQMSSRPADAQIRHWVWQSIGHGADMVSFFRWRSCLYGTEQYWHGILNHDGIPRRRYRTIAKVGQELKALSSEIDGTVVKNEVAILNSYEQNWSYQIQPQSDGLVWWDQVRKYHDSLLRLGLTVDVVPIAADLAKYKLVILPGWYLLSESDAQTLKDYVDGGGTLIISPRTGVKNDVNTCRPEPLPSLLRAVAGIEVDDYDPLGKNEKQIRLSDGREFTVSVWADALALRGAESVATYTVPLFEGEPAISKNTFGQGTAYYFGVFGEPSFYDAFLGDIVDGLGVSRLQGLPEGVDLCRRVKNGAEYVFLINLRNEQKEVPVTDELVMLLGPSPEDGKIVLPAFEVGVYRV